jgi:hypothetical protein
MDDTELRTYFENVSLDIYHGHTFIDFEDIEQPQKVILSPLITNQILIDAS